MGNRISKARIKGDLIGLKSCEGIVYQKAGTENRVLVGRTPKGKILIKNKGKLSLLGETAAVRMIYNAAPVSSQPLFERGVICFTGDPS